MSAKSNIRAVLRANRLVAEDARIGRCLNDPRLIRELLKALEAAEHALGCFLQPLDPTEIRDSFQREAKAHKTVRAALAKARDK
jgi:hypothetical protein